MRNRFFLWGLHSPCASEFRPEDPLSGAAYTDLRYFVGIMRELDAALTDQGVTFLLTWHLDAFDDRFRDSVVILVGDEKHQTPSYAGIVRAIFKTGGIRPNQLRTTLRLAPAVAWRVALRDLRNTALSLRRRLIGRPSGPGRMFELPMGYFALRETPFIPFAERSVDIFFGGSIENDRGFTVRPRLAARREMLGALAAARRRLPALQLDCTSAGPFGNPRGILDPETYSARLMQAKLALCPQGNIDETFRLTEAARSGCVAITESLPARWYYRDAPVIQIDRWASLPQTLEALLSDPRALEQRSELMRHWWEECLSEPAAARFIVSALSDFA